jgi:hypothetical protein
MVVSSASAAAPSAFATLPSASMTLLSASAVASAYVESSRDETSRFNDSTECICSSICLCRVESRRDEQAVRSVGRTNGRTDVMCCGAGASFCCWLLERNDGALNRDHY